MSKTLKEWYEEAQPEASGIMRVVSQNFDNVPEQVPQQQEPEETPEKEEDVQKATNIMTPLFLASVIKASLEELLKISNIDLTKEFKDDMISKAEKLKEELGKL